MTMEYETTSVSQLNLHDHGLLLFVMCATTFGLAGWFIGWAVL